MEEICSHPSLEQRSLGLSRLSKHLGGFWFLTVWFSYVQYSFFFSLSPSLSLSLSLLSFSFFLFLFFFVSFAAVYTAEAFMASAPGPLKYRFEFHHFNPLVRCTTTPVTALFIICSLTSAIWLMDRTVTRLLMDSSIERKVKSPPL